MNMRPAPPDVVGQVDALRSELRTATPERRAEILRELELVERARAVTPRRETA